MFIYYNYTIYKIKFINVVNLKTSPENLVCFETLADTGDFFLMSLFLKLSRSAKIEGELSTNFRRFFARSSRKFV